MHFLGSCWLLLYQQKQGQGGWGVGALDYSTHLTHISAFFMTSLLQAAGHKMAALTVVFWRLSDVDLSANRTRNRTNFFSKILVWASYSISIDNAYNGSSARFSFKLQLGLNLFSWLNRPVETELSGDLSVVALRWVEWVRSWLSEAASPPSSSVDYSRHKF